jgi:hypothetical protein
MTDSIKPCVDCRYCRTDPILDGFYTCAHPALEVEDINYVYGTKSTTSLLCCMNREGPSSTTRCGPEGRYWEPKPVVEEAPPTEPVGGLYGRMKRLIELLF